MNQISKKIIILMFIIFFSLLVIINFNCYLNQDDWKFNYLPNITILNRKRNIVRNLLGRPFLKTRHPTRLSRKSLNQVRIVCWVLTQPKNHETKALAVKKTWGSRCNKLIFISTKNNSDLNAVVVPIEEKRNLLWGKTKEAFKYVYKHFLNDGDWFLKADDDTYVIIENLRFMLSTHNSRKPIYFGCKFKPYVKQGYMSGGAGYVLSKEALRRFVQKGLHDKSKCELDNAGAEDVEIGKCLENVGVVAGDSRDSEKRNTFFPFLPRDHLIPGYIGPTLWFWNFSFYEQQVGPKCCSKYSVSFHYITANQFYVMDYLIYNLRVFGLNYNNKDL